MGLEKILAIEDSKLLSFKLHDGTPIWPLIRYNVLLSQYNLVCDANDSSTRHVNDVSKMEIVKNLFLGLFKISISRSSIQIISSTLFNVKNDGIYQNILDDYYAECYKENTYIYEEADKRNYSHRYPRTNSRVSFHFTYLNLMVSILSRLNKVKKFNDLNTFCEYLSSRGVDLTIVNQARITAIYFNRSISLYRFFYRLYLKLAKPKIVMVNCAAYGTANSILINEARKRGVATSEIQHGMIGSNHIAYNYSKEIVDDLRLNEYRPQYFLTFGEFWNRYMNMASRKIVLGNPHLNKISESNINDEVEKDSYLFVSAWTVTNELLLLALELRKELKDAKITFRLHPIETLNDEQRFSLLSHNIQISGGVIDLYDEIKLHECIVGCFSTCLFEAKAFNKKVIILNHPFAEDSGIYEIGTVVRNGKDICDVNKQTSSDITENDIWERDFKDRYKDFIDSL